MRTSAGRRGWQWAGAAVVMTTMVAASTAGVLGPGASAGGAATAPASGMSGPAIAHSPRVHLRQGAATPPAGAQVIGPVPASTTVSVDVALAPSDPSGLSAAVAAVSTPSSPQYRHFLTPQEFATRFAPSQATVAAVERWLAAEGLSVGSVPSDRLDVPVKGSASAVAEAFGTALTQVQLPTSHQAYLPTVAPTVPSPVSSAIEGVVGLSTVPHLHPFLTAGDATGSAAAGASAGASTQVAPAVTGSNAGPRACADAAGSTKVRSFTRIASLYGISGLYGQGRTGAGVTVAIFELENYTAGNVATFEQCYGLSTSVRDVPVDGGPRTTPPGSGVESALDIEEMAALAPDASLEVFQGPNSPVGAYDTYQAIATTPSVQVVSTSWGECETTAQATPTGAPTAEATLFDKMASLGKTVFAAAGDTGSEGCYYPTGAKQLAVDDPASQPTVTGVGGTELGTTTTGRPTAQSAWNSGPPHGAGGGGVSSIWKMPEYQVTAGVTTTTTYPKTYVVAHPCPDAGPTGTSGCRTVPDVSADADPTTGYEIYDRYEGGWINVGGTSAATPLWAALTAVTDQGCNTSMGMINTLLYNRPAVRSALTDVTTGTNAYVGTTDDGKYRAHAGYNMATGLGTPIGTALLAALQPPGGCPSVTGLSTSHGPVGGGTTVTISGSDLAGATAVHFGSEAATIESDSTGSVTVQTQGVSGPGLVYVSATTPNGTSALTGNAEYAYGTTGYWEVASDGGIFTFGDAQFDGSEGGKLLNKPIVGMAATPTGGGYWEVASDGGIFTFGDAQFYGSEGGHPLNEPIVGMAAMPTGHGYWEVASDGGIFTFGDAQFYGSEGGHPLNEPIVGMAAMPTGHGYWEVASDGGIFTFGDAQFYGSEGGKSLNAPIVGMAAMPTGHGYWEVASDGGIFTFGDAQFYGSEGGKPLNKPIVGMAATPDGGGYREVASDGGIFTFGDAPFYGSEGGKPLNEPIVGTANS